MTCAPSRVTSVTLPSRLHLKHLTEVWPGSMKLLAPQTGQFFSHGNDVIVDDDARPLALGWSSGAAARQCDRPAADNLGLGA